MGILNSHKNRVRYPHSNNTQKKKTNKNPLKIMQQNTTKSKSMDKNSKLSNQVNWENLPTSQAANFGQKIDLNC